MKTNSLKIRIGRILTPRGLRRSTYSSRNGWTRGYRFEGDKNNILIEWSAGGWSLEKEQESTKLRYIHQVLTDQGLGEYLEQYKQGDGAIRFKNLTE